MQHILASMPVADTSYPLRGGAASALGIPPSEDALLVIPNPVIQPPSDSFQGYAKRTLDPLPEPSAPPPLPTQNNEQIEQPPQEPKSPLNMTKGFTVSLIMTMALLITMGLFAVSVWRHRRGF